MLNIDIYTLKENKRYGYGFPNNVIIIKANVRYPQA
jgi:hypothetical protein